MINQPSPQSYAGFLIFYIYGVRFLKMGDKKHKRFKGHKTFSLRGSKQHLFWGKKPFFLEIKDPFFLRAKDLFFRAKFLSFL
jgi:hypothetical protein